jgi:aminoglycoside 2''-phosphotransferase
MLAEMTLDDYRNWLTIQLPQVIVPDAALVWIDSGWDSRVLEVNGQWIFQFARRPEITGQFRKELRLLPELAGRLPCTIPNPVFTRLDDPKFICMGYRKLNGEALSDATATTAMATQIGAFLNCLHQFPLDSVSQTGLIVLRADVWRTQYLDFYRWVQKGVLPQVSETLRKNMRNLWEDFLDTEENFHFTPVLIHGDLGVEHILVDPDSDRLVGVIDWGDARVGDPALDFAGLLASCGADFVSQVLGSYARRLDGRFWQRMAFYRDIQPFYRMHYGMEVGDKRCFAEGLQAFASSQDKIETDANL